MILPIWYFPLWIAAASLAACCCVLLITRRCIYAWPSLFACGALEVIGYCVLVPLLYPHPYRHYFWAGWTLAGVMMLARIWLAFDVLRAIPNYKVVSFRYRCTCLCAGIIAALTFSAYHLPHLHLQPQDIATAIDRSVNYAWAIVVVFCAYGIFFAGYGFTLTGIRMAIGMILRLLSSLYLASVVADAGYSRSFKAAINTLDTCVGIGITAYVCFTITRASADAASFRDDWQRHREQLLPDTEKDGLR